MIRSFFYSPALFSILLVTCLPCAAEDAKKKPEKSASAPAAAEPLDGSSRDALQAKVGQTVTVKGVVKAVKDWDGGQAKKKKMNFVNLKGGAFTAVTFEDDYAAFNGTLPAAMCAGKEITVTGTLTERQGEFQIIVKKPDQITVLGDASTDEKKDQKDGEKKKANKKEK